MGPQDENNGDGRKSGYVNNELSAQEICIIIALLALNQIHRKWVEPLYSKGTTSSGGDEEYEGSGTR